ncbi:hypothetical protein BG74_06775 [Sodalis-like endosymbiont of Proechinophthirus fluctus]|nr:hypothetical protein BG74_06775 [Sodalis-like endosymbiont of Proechinophthirus fluctus]
MASVKFLIFKKGGKINVGKNETSQLGTENYRILNFIRSRREKKITNACKSCSDGDGDGDGDGDDK